MIEELNRVLRHLYDLAYLETSSLAVHVNPVSGSGSRGTALRRTIVDAIESLRPPAGTPAEAPSWRAYQILEGRYIAGMSRAETQDELALAKSQYYRDHTKAVEALASILSDRWQSEIETVATRDVASAPAPDSVSGGQELALLELDELVRQESEQLVDLRTLLIDVSALLGATLPPERQLVLALQDAPLTVRSRPGILRQALLLMLSALARNTQNGNMRVSATSGGDITLSISVIGQVLDRALLQMKGSNRDVMMGFLAAAGGEVVLPTGEGDVHRVRIRFREGRVAMPVLLVDNSRELADLYTRYLEGQPWALRYAGSVTEAMTVCVDEPPSLVLLDVLMPDRDGWHLLAYLKRDKRTRHIPVVICSVLDQPQLALSLGATGYLRKPISRQGLIDALSRWALSDPQ